MVRFKHVVSLGGHCAVRFHIDRFFGRSGSGPFEWTVTPLWSLISVLDTRGENLGTSVSTISDGHSAVDAVHGICYHHEFARGAGEKVIITADAIGALQSKMLHKWNRLLHTLEEGPILFIRYGGPKKDAIADIGRADEPVSHSMLNGLTASIDRLVLGLDYRVLFVNHPNVWGVPVIDEALDHRVDIHEFSWDHGSEWHGNIPEWDRIFSHYGSRVAPGPLTPA